MSKINGSDVWNGVEMDVTRDDVLPFEDEITRIYRAYRTCYSKEPWVEPEIDTTTQNDLLMEFRDHMRYAYSWTIWGEDLKEQKINSLILDRLDKFGTERFIRYLYRARFIKRHMHHQSALEHASFTVTFTDVDRIFSHQLCRHRIASLSQQSQRYCSETNPEFVVPDSIQDNPEARKIFAQFVNQLPGIIAALKELGIPTEDIRTLYPNAIKTRLVMTANWREWIHIWDERRCSRASARIRECMDSVYWMAVEYVPFIFDDVSPKCRTLQRCPEAKPCSKCGEYLKK